MTIRFEYSENKKQKVTIAFDWRIHIRWTWMSEEMKNELYLWCIRIKEYLNTLWIITSIRWKYYIWYEKIILKNKKHVFHFSFQWESLSIEEIINE